MADNIDRNFIYRRKFPDPKTIFNRSKVEINTLFESGIFLLDANVLLAPFQVGKENLEKIHKVYFHLNKEGRIFIPEHALIEFYNNRSSKISELFTTIDRYLSELPSIKEFNYPILEQLSAYSEILVHRSEISDSVKNYKKSLNKLKEGVTNWNWSDPVTMMYKEVFSEKNIISIEEDEDSLIEQYNKRMLNDIPPGNKDNLKTANSIGDFIIWKTILKAGKTLKKNVIFVSNDEKNDWMLKGNTKSISTRYELIDEFFRDSNGFNFHSISYIEFLNRQGLIVSEIENKLNSSITNLEQLLDSIYNHLKDFIENNPEGDEDIFLDPDILEQYMSNLEHLILNSTITSSSIDGEMMFSMKELLSKIKIYNYSVYYEWHRMKHSAKEEALNLNISIIKFINIYESYTLGKHF